MEYIDLGLPSGTKWASCNLGAERIEEYGNYFAWGDTFTKQVYVRSNCKTYDLDYSNLSYEDYVNSYILTKEYDAAAHSLGGKWCIPSGEQAQELVDNCDWEWVSNYNQSGINGRLGTSKINGAKIFLPAAGYMENSNVFLDGKNGGYWTSSPNIMASNRAWSLAFDSSVINVFDHGLRYFGYSIRPVFKE